jgi:hypothetical protein
MSVNIDKVLERGEKIDLLVEKTEKMETSAANFRRASSMSSSVMLLTLCAQSDCGAVVCGVGGLNVCLVYL